MSEELPSKIAQLLRGNHSKNIAEGLRQSFLEMDDRFLKTDSSNSGSTATVIAWDLDRGVLYVANTGDTRAVLCRRGLAVDLSKDRKASDPEEILRILLNGGNITNNRVMGSLAITRAFGDKQLKKLNKTLVPEATIGFNRDVLTVEPEVTIADIIVDIDEFVVLATDGLWDVMTSQEVVSMIRQQLEDEQRRTSSLSTSFDGDRRGSRYESISSQVLDKIADQLVNHAINNLGSLDNVTVMILCLNSPSRSDDLMSADMMTAPPCHSIQRIFELYGRKDVMPDSREMKVTVAISPKLTDIMGASALASNSNDAIDLFSVDQTAVESKSNNAPPSPSHKRKASEQADDMMDFLLDDSNF
jgi:serine/threonine protein phosphatase PrpC